MALSIKDPEAVRLAREERLAQDVQNLVDEVMRIGQHFAALPVRDPRQLEEMLYDESGLPA